MEQLLYLHTLVFMLFYNAKQLLLFYIMLLYTKLQYYISNRKCAYIEYAYYTKINKNDPLYHIGLNKRPNKMIDITNEIKALYVFNSRITINKMITWLHYFDTNIDTVHIKYKYGDTYMISNIDLVNKKELYTNRDIIGGCLNLDKLLPHICVSD